ncbi:MAG: helix-turn-helix domain-containing protein [Proteobacteria bacterium]|nr:helix-turn-helix domain-containing protein [Pseudomonadota bacterium]
MRSARVTLNPAAGPRAPDIGLRSAWFEPCVHSAYFQILAGLLAERGLAAPRTYSGAARLMPLLDFLPLLDTLGLPPEASAGVEVGWAITGAAHGPMGLAAMTSDTLSHAMSTVARYAPIRNRMFDYHHSRQGGEEVLSMPARMPLGAYQPFLQAATLYAIFNVFRAVLDDSALQQAAICLPWPDGPAGAVAPVAARYPVRFRSEELAIRFPQALASHRLSSADADTHQRLRRAGDEELTKLSGSVAARVRHLLHQAQPDWPTLEDIAQVLCISRRTLLRKLKAEGLSYQDLMDEARNELACWYLRHTALSLAQVSAKIGFSEQANFSRSFRRWQGLTPSDYRACFNAPASRTSPSRPA